MLTNILQYSIKETHVFTITLNCMILFLPIVLP